MNEISKYFEIGKSMDYSIPKIHKHIAHFDGLMKTPYTNLFGDDHTNLKRHLEALYCLLNGLASTDDYDNTVLLHLTVVLSVKLDKLKKAVFKERPYIQSLYNSHQQDAKRYPIHTKEEIGGEFGTFAELCFWEDYIDELDEKLANLMCSLDVQLYVLLAENLEYLRYNHKEKSFYLDVDLARVGDMNSKTFISNHVKAYGEELRPFVEHETYLAMQTYENSFFSTAMDYVRREVRRIWSEMALCAYHTIALQYLFSPRCSKYLKYSEKPINRVEFNDYMVIQDVNRLFKLALPYTFKHLDYMDFDTEEIVEEYKENNKEQNNE